MACGCNYNSNCGSYNKASYTPSSSLTSVSYTSKIESGSVSYLSASNSGMGSYQGTSQSDGYLPLELDYKLSNALKEMGDISKDYKSNDGVIKEIPFKESKGEIIPVKPTVVEVRPEHRELIDALGNRSDKINVVGSMPNKLILQEIEEEIVLIRKRKIRQIVREE